MATFALENATRISLALIGYIGLFGQAAERAPSSMFFLPMLIIGLLYYVMVVRPEQTNRAEQVSQLDKLKQNDRVITAGGIHGVVVKATKGDPEVVLRIDESNSTKIHIQRSSISRIVTDKDKNKDSQES